MAADARASGTVRLSVFRRVGSLAQGQLPSKRKGHIQKQGHSRKPRHLVGYNGVEDDRRCSATSAGNPGVRGLQRTLSNARTPFVFPSTSACKP